MPGFSLCTKARRPACITHHPQTLPKHIRCSFHPCAHRASPFLSKICSAMVSTANTGSHIFLIIFPPSRPSWSPSFCAPSRLSPPSCRVSLLQVYKPSSSLFTAIPSSPRPCPAPPPPPMSDLASLSAAGVRWLPSPGMSSTVHRQHEVGYFKAYLPRVLMSEKSRAVLLMALIWLQPPRLLGVCLCIA